jgi:polar amino acid transport system substrate-binding protein
LLEDQEIKSLIFYIQILIVPIMSLSGRGTDLVLLMVCAGLLVMVSGCITEKPASGATAAGDLSSLTLYTEENYPYNYEMNGSLEGISVDLFGKITEKMGYPVPRETIRLAPWSEGYQAALTGNRTMIFAIARIPSRETSFKWAGPIYPYTTAVFALPDSGIGISAPGDLLQYRIGAVTDDAAVQQLLDAGVNRSRIVLVAEEAQLIEAIQNGTIDLWADSEISGRILSRTLTGNAYSFRVVHRFPPMEIYYGFSRDVPDATVQSFQQALDSLKREKDSRGVTGYDAVVGKYIPAVGLGQLSYLTEEWAPFNYADKGVPSGISVEILDAIFQTMGVNRTRADVQIVPLSEGFRRTQGNDTVLFSIVRSKERDPLYQWAGPFTKARFVVWAPAEKNITIASPADMNRYRIGAVKGTIENTLLANEGVSSSNIVNGLVPADLIRMLEADQIDLWATGDVTGRYELQAAGADPDTYEIVHTLSENDFYFIFSKNVPADLVSAFSDGIETVKNQADAQGLSEYQRIIYRNIGVGCTRQPFSDEAVVALVNRTAADIRKDAPGTFRLINAGQAPYRDTKNPELYVFVYDTAETFVAHGSNVQLVGVSYKGKTDVTGKPLHDEIVSSALKNGTGWKEYVYISPVQTNLYYKHTYYSLTTGSDGKSYIVAAGNFRKCS